MTIQPDVALATHCTLGVGGAARWFCRATTEEEVHDALAWASQHQLPVHVLGGGSNVVFADEGFPGLVIHVDIRGIETTVADGRVTFVAGAGEPWDPFVAHTVAANCAGLECLSGIPGQVGGTPVQNVGAYGQDVSATISHVNTINRETNRAVQFAAAECAFGYRTSRFKHQDANQYIVTGVAFALTQDAPPTVSYADVVAYCKEAGDLSPSLSAVRAATIHIRRRKGMVIEEGNPANHSCGSFFVNPIISRAHLARVEARVEGASPVPHYPLDTESVKLPAAWLIERSGFSKGVTRGPVGISPFQAQAIINHGGARAADVLALASDIKRAVFDTFAVAIVPEPVFVGFPPTDQLQWLLDPRERHVDTRY
ncbi:MAG TPA: UDP-N-acetylmuramate dehydrogenase [Vicinamibacterales bacterium]|nr:UDP-N-acetylmuramate dehydrogenase [Vicinamibacterales bacterium]